MGQDLEPQGERRRVPSVIALAVACVICAVLLVAVTRAGVDLLLIVAVCAGMLIVERSLGDWLGDLLGPGAASLVIAGCLLFGVWYLLSGDHTTPAQRFLDGAKQRGYHSVYFGREPPGGVGVGAAAEARPVNTGGSSTSKMGRPALGVPSITLHVPAGARAPSPSRTSPTPPTAGPQPTGSAGKVRSGHGGSATGDGVHRASRTVLPGSTTALMLTPPIAVMGQTIEARSIVSTASGPVADGSIEFAVNGRRIALVLLGSTNNAVARFTPRAPGTYTVRAEFSGNDSMSGSSTIAVLTVVPDK